MKPKTETRYELQWKNKHDAWQTIMPCTNSKVAKSCVTFKNKKEFRAVKIVTTEL